MVLLKIPWRSFLKYQYQFAIKQLAKKRGPYSERSLATKAGLSRSGLRPLMAREINIRVDSIAKLALQLDRDIYILATSPTTNSDLSTIALSYKISHDGFDSWKVHLMDFVDEFRRTLDPQLFILEPTKKLHPKLMALLASTVLFLSHEAQIDPPTWALKNYFLQAPWFVSGMQSLKAIALVESPLFFRKNNIFVLNNFLERI